MSGVKSKLFAALDALVAPGIVLMAVFLVFVLGVTPAKMVSESRASMRKQNEGQQPQKVDVRITQEVDDPRVPIVTNELAGLRKQNTILSNKLVVAESKILELESLFPKNNLLNTDSAVRDAAANRVVAKIMLLPQLKVLITARNKAIQEEVALTASALKQIFEFCRAEVIYTETGLTIQDGLTPSGVYIWSRQSTDAMMSLVDSIYDEIGDDKKVNIVTNLAFDLEIQVWPKH